MTGLLEVSRTTETEKYFCGCQRKTVWTLCHSHTKSQKRIALLQKQLREEKTRLFCSLAEPDDDDDDREAFADDDDDDDQEPLRRWVHINRALKPDWSTQDALEGAVVSPRVLHEAQRAGIPDTGGVLDFYGVSLKESPAEGLKHILRLIDNSKHAFVCCGGVVVLLGGVVGLLLLEDAPNEEVTRLASALADLALCRHVSSLSLMGTQFATMQGKRLYRALAERPDAARVFGRLLWTTEMSLSSGSWKKVIPDGMVATLKDPIFTAHRDGLSKIRLLQ